MSKHKRKIEETEPFSPPSTTLKSSLSSPSFSSSTSSSLPHSKKQQKIQVENDKTGDEGEKLDIAVENGDADIVSRLLDAGGNVDITFGALKEVLFLLPFLLSSNIHQTTDITSRCHWDGKLANGEDVDWSRCSRRCSWLCCPFFHKSWQCLISVSFISCPRSSVLLLIAWSRDFFSLFLHLRQWTFRCCHLSGGNGSSSFSSWQCFDLFFFFAPTVLILVMLVGWSLISFFNFLPHVELALLTFWLAPHYLEEDVCSSFCSTFLFITISIHVKLQTPFHDAACCNRRM